MDLTVLAADPTLCRDEANSSYCNACHTEGTGLMLHTVPDMNPHNPGT